MIGSYSEEGDEDPYEARGYFNRHKNVFNFQEGIFTLPDFKTGDFSSFIICQNPLDFDKSLTGRLVENEPQSIEFDWLNNI